MRRSAAALFAAVLLMQGMAARAAEKGLVIRAGDLLSQPFIDAASAAKLTAAQPVTVVARRGAWANVEANGKSGWVRLLNLRLQPAGAPPTLAGAPKPKPGPMSLTSALRTNSSDRTVTTGVKGMDEADIRAATPDPEQIILLDSVAVDAQEARTTAASAKLIERKVEYLAKGRSK